MLLKFLFDENLAHASYLIGCQETGEALVMDPGRDPMQYARAAAEEGLKLIAAAETHIHADFLSGARELAARSGIRLYLSGEGGPDWSYGYLDEYDHVLLQDGAQFMLGNLRFEVQHTPGHTPEHLIYFLTDTLAADEPLGVFSGDFVFVGDVGRPDLLEEAVGVENAAQPAGRQLYHSLQRFKNEPDHLQIWPAHRAGSACGKALGAVPSTTVGYERRFNPAFQIEDEDDFVGFILDGQPDAPHYFARMKRFNRDGPPLLSAAPRLEASEYSQLFELMEAGGQIVDTRLPAVFSKGHIPGTFNLPLTRGFTNNAGWILDDERPIGLITDGNALPMVLRDLHAIGLDDIRFFWQTAVLTQWAESKGELESYNRTNPVGVVEQIQDGSVILLDVRRKDEWDEAHVPQAMHIPLDDLGERLNEVTNDKPIVVHCQSGVRSAIAVSLLQANGLADVCNLEGGILALQASSLPLETDAG